ncbi:CPBP family intramembrane glutamic endopeptidase [Lewinella sp. IMCC34191]|uniref:CPBP family intramembrane glutamic endopeptidase n=1 Tax=Lewinella sp. IMCC34191 TaxID=2259172 RepID=UPI000E22B078|nr:CPBP family intramembrane glutamic endopeptidase [Lewinella sp. IMCC34191]
MSLALHVVFLLLGVIIPTVLFVTTGKRTSARSLRWTSGLKVRMYYANGSLLLSLAALVMIVWYFTGRPYSEFGLGWGELPYDSVAVGVIFLFLVLYGVDLYGEIGNPERQDETRKKFRELGFLPANGGEYLHFLFLCLAAGVGEEIVYRGFMITYLRELLTSSEPWAAAVTLLFPAVSFGLAHYYQGAQAVIKIVAMALLFGFFYYRTGTLWPLILLHTAIDAVGGLLNWALERQS